MLVDHSILTVMNQHIHSRGCNRRIQTEPLVHVEQHLQQSQHIKNVNVDF
jgi:hypothetical protein